MPLLDTCWRCFPPCRVCKSGDNKTCRTIVLFRFVSAAAFTSQTIESYLCASCLIVVFSAYSNKPRWLEGFVKLCPQQLLSSFNFLTNIVNSEMFALSYLALGFLNLVKVEALNQEPEGN